MCCTCKVVFLLIRSIVVVFYRSGSFQLVFSIRACLHGVGGPQVSEVTRGGSPRLTFKRDHIKMRDYMDRRVTPPKQVTSPTWAPQAPCKQVLTRFYLYY